jgi:Protein of unknown function (DUF4012)
MDYRNRPRRRLWAPRRATDPSQEETLHLPSLRGDAAQDGTAPASHADRADAATELLPAPGVDTAQQETVILATLRPRSTRDTAGNGNVRRPPGLRLAQALFLVILFVNVVGVGGIWGFEALSVSRSATASLQRRIARIQELARQAGALQPAVLGALQAELKGAETDVRTLNALLPFNGGLEFGGQGAAHRVLTLSQHALGAATEGAAAAVILAPALQGLIFSVTRPNVNPVANGQHLLDGQDVLIAQSHLDQAQKYWAAAVQDRKSVTSADLESLHNAQVSQLVARFDALAPDATKGLGLASALLDWAPHIMGLAGPAHILLFDMDTDELRATGGFLGNYADLVMNGGALTSGVHLHDVYTLDCPNGVCPLRLVPEEYSWFKIAGSHFGVRDSNLNPDFPTAAGLAERLYEEQGGPPADMVVAITPAVIEGIMRALGPIRVARFGVTVTADTMRSQIHYYHQNPQIAQSLGISPTALGTSIAKVFDVLLAQEIFAKLGALTAQQQGALAKSMLSYLTTKDIQLFASNSRVEALFTAIGVAGQVVQPTEGDAMYLVDTNDGGSYANADLRESFSDHVMLDASGGATHAMTITYTYAIVAHPYSQITEYRNLARVIVPSAATRPAVSGPCAPVSSVQAYHQVIACQFSLTRGASTSISYSWYAPSGVVAGQTPRYRLFVQRQAGTAHGAHITVTPAPGATLSSLSGPGSITGGSLEWTQNPQTVDTALVVGVRS